MTRAHMTGRVRASRLRIFASSVLIAVVVLAAILPSTADAQRPPANPLVDGATVLLVNAESGRFLDADRREVSTSLTPKRDDRWVLEQTAAGTWQLRNVRFNRYLDADGNAAAFNVDIAPEGRRGTEWQITVLPSGNFEVRSVVFDRLLDYDVDNVDTDTAASLETEWFVVQAPGG